MQVQALTLCFSRETIMIVDNLGLSVGQRGKVKNIIEAIQEYVDGHIDESVERRNFRHRKQQPGEIFDDFLVSLRELAKTCKFCSKECTQKNIRDQIIKGLIDGDAVETLLREKDLSLQAAMLKCRSQEAAKRQRAEIAGDPALTIRKTLVNPFPPNKTKYYPPHSFPPSRSNPPPTRVCLGCGGDFHPGGRRQCPAYSLTCHTCNHVGHLARVCQSGQ